MEGEENKLTTFYTWTIVLGCNESNIISSSISANLGNSGEATVEIHKYSVFMAATLSYFCELVEGEENKLTTFYTWTIVLGCNESKIIFQQHLCKLGQLQRSNGRNSQVFGIYGRHTFVLFVS